MLARRLFLRLLHHVGKKDLHEVGVPLRTRASAKLRDSSFRCSRGSVGTVARHRVIGVTDRDDHCRRWYLATLQPFGIAASVMAFVVVPDDRPDARGRPQPARDIDANPYTL